MNSKRFLAMVVVVTCTTLLLIGCGSGEGTKNTNQREQFRQVSSIWINDESGSGKRIISAPEGQSFLIFYAADDLGGNYHNNAYKLVGDNEYEQEKPGTRLERDCSTDELMNDGTPTGNPFEVFRLTFMASGEQVQCLSLVFLIPDEVTAGKILKQKSGSWEEVATFTLSELGNIE